MPTHDSTHLQDKSATRGVAPRPRRAPSSLAYTGQLVTAARPLSCPYARDRVIVELHSGTVLPDRCGTLGCAFCLPLQARRRTLAITLAAPQRMIRLSWVADRGDETPCHTASTRIKRIRQALKRMDVPAGEWCWTIEKNPKETGFHAHCLQTGPFLPQNALQTACQRARAGQPFINAIKRTNAWASRYGLKGFGADGYGLKTFRPQGDPAAALKINNGRLEHHTDGFFNFNGKVLGVKDMERAAIGALNADQPKAFMAMHSSSVDRVLSDPLLRHRLILDVKMRTAEEDHDLD